MTKITDQAARDAALNPRQSFIVQAPAGSGKTELLTQRFLSLLSTVNHPEEIVAVTFTRKAAGEMHARIIQALQSGLAAEPEQAHAKVTWQLAQRVLAHSKQQQWDVLKNPNRLRVTTIDSLCASITRQLPVTASFGSQPTISDNADFLYQKAANNLLLSLADNHDWQSALKALLLHVDNQQQRLQQLFVNLLQKRDQWLPYIIHPDRTLLKSQLESGLKHAIDESLEKIIQHLSADQQQTLLELSHFAAEQVQTVDSESKIIACLSITHFPAANWQSFSDWQALAELLLTKKGEVRKRLDKRCGFPAASAASNAEQKQCFKQQKERMTTLLDSIREHEDLVQALSCLCYLPPASYSEKQWDILHHLMDLLPILVAHLSLVFRQYASVDFTEISSKALQALGHCENPSEIALRLDYQIKHILIDEFQDTSHTQYQLLESLTAGWQIDDDKTLFLVGDPMQSIYRFRQAQVGLFLRAIEHGINQLPLTFLQLNSNFRSQANVVDWLNTYFSRIFPANNDLTAGAVSYSPSFAAKPDTGHCSHYFLTPDKTSEAQHIIDIIKSKLEHTDEDIAILVKARSHLQCIVPLLKQENIAFSAVDIDYLANNTVIQDLWSLTQALFFPADRLAWYSILRAPWAGIPLADCLKIHLYKPQQVLWQNLQGDLSSLDLSDQTITRLTHFINVIKQAFAQRYRLPLRDWIEQTWLQLGGKACLTDQQSLTDVAAFFDCLEKNEVAGRLLDVDNFADQLSRLYASTPGESRVKVMTIHKAKGLEFDNVILPGLEQTPAVQSSALMLWTERVTTHNSEDLILAPIKASDEEHDPIYQYVKTLEQQKERFELARLLYVAITRAKSACFFFATVDPEKTDFTPGKSSFLQLLWPHLQHEFVNNRLPASDIQLHNKQLAPNTILRLPLECYSQLPVIETPACHASVSYQFNDDAKRIIGIVLHECLQYLPVSQEWSSFTVCKQLIAQRLRSHGLSVIELTSACQQIHAALNNVLHDEKAHWIFSADHQHIQAELAITSHIDDQLKQLIIDRTFIDNEQTRWIIDYKTTENTDPTLHQDQLNQYAKAMQQQQRLTTYCGLYYPLTSTWHQWQFELLS